VSRDLAERLGIPYIDTGAMYRAVAVACLRAGMEAPLDDDDVEQLRKLLPELDLDVELSDLGVRAVLDGEDVTGLLRAPEVSSMASAVSALGFVRRALVARQRLIAERNGGVVEGRDIGTVVLPDASLKVYLTAAPEVRAERRWRELRDRGHDVSLKQVRAEQDERDRRDSTRADSPLTAATDALVLDSSELSRAEVVDRIVAAFQPGHGKSGSELDSSLEEPIKSRNCDGS
jgi:cytidylate kinase